MQKTREMRQSSKPKRTDATRGFGLLENFLSRQRMRQADGHIPKACRSGKILDIGCGNYPLFLISIEFYEKYALDKYPLDNQETTNNIQYIHQDIEYKTKLPFPDDYFDVVSMLAVIEHLDPQIIPRILKEVNRIVKKNGLFILTTPAAWTDSLLRVMALIKLVSADEINEHKDVYTPKKISSILEDASFSQEKIACGYFEFGMNIWAKAGK